MTRKSSPIKVFRRMVSLTAAGVGDFLEGGSPTRIVPELQHLRPGDEIETDPGSGFTVVRADALRLLLRDRISTKRTASINNIAFDFVGLVKKSGSGMPSKIVTGSSQVKPRL